MRLTLRTMLAYLDDILDPDDATELAQKIEESRFAVDLVHRIRNSTRRLRLGAPKLQGRGIGLDANSVAEYLDNTLSTDSVPEFEKVCLESDVHLAEVASCHQILTLVLGEAADVDDALKNRIYEIREPAPDIAKTLLEPPDLDFGDSDEEMDEMAEPPAKSDALQDSNSFPAQTVVFTLVISFLLALIGISAFNKFNSPPAPGPEVAEGDGQTPSAGTGESAGEAEDSSEEGAATAPATSGETETESTGADTTEADSTATGDTATAETGTGETGTGETASTEAGASDTASAPAGGGEAEPEKEIDPIDLITADVVLDEEDMEESPAKPATDSTPPPVVAETPAPAPTAAPAETVGRYISEEQVLAAWNRAAGAWFRLQPNSALSTGDRLIVPPTYRPQIFLNSQLNITFAGLSDVEIASAEMEATPELRVAFGRMLVVPLAAGDAELVLDLGDREDVVFLDDINTVAAVSIQRYLVPGSDAETTGAELLIEVYTLSGRLRWQVAGMGDPVEVPAGSVMSQVGSDEPQIRQIDEAPDWVAGGEMKSIERRASRELREALGHDRNLELSLMEQVESRRAEHRSLASRFLACLDIYEPLLEMLNSDQQRSYWDGHFDLLRQIQARGPEQARRLREVANSVFREDGETITRLLQGFSPDQLARGSSHLLVDLLESPTMGIRVAAYMNLQRITGMTHLYNPRLDPEQSRGSIAKWKQALRDGRVVYREPPVGSP